MVIYKARKAKHSLPLVAPPSTLVSNHSIVQKEKHTASGVLFFLEQVTRVELAGNSLGSCRHTARRHLHCYLITDLIIAILREIVNPFLSLSSIL